jgi:uncharacterized OsmC-like protein
MSEERIHHVTVRLAHDYQFIAEFDDVQGRPALFLDEPPPLGGGRGPSAAEVLGAAVGNCLAASLAFCLRRARIELDGLTAGVTTHIARNEKGRYRIRGIDVELDPQIAGELARLDRCGDLFEDFCIVTASVRQGIPVRISLKPRVESAPKCA